jgi:hypothetical protein
METEALVECVTEFSTDWELKLRYQSKIELSSGMIYPLVILNLCCAGCRNRIWNFHRVHFYFVDFTAAARRLLKNQLVLDKTAFNMSLNAAAFCQEERSTKGSQYRDIKGFGKAQEKGCFAIIKKKLLECIDKHQEAVCLFNAGPPQVSQNAAIAKPSDAFAMEILGRQKPKLEP